jgi:hypothetical protein
MLRSAREDWSLHFARRANTIVPPAASGGSRAFTPLITASIVACRLELVIYSNSGGSYLLDAHTLVSGSSTARDLKGKGFQAFRPAFKNKGAQMPDHTDPDLSQFPETALSNFILLALPLLTLQRDVLEIAKKGIQAGTNTPTERFAASELQALMMILDKSRTFRNLIDEDFEKNLQNTCKEVFPKLASASVQLIEAQDKVLSGIFDALNKLRTEKKAKNHPSKKGAD